MCIGGARKAQPSFTRGACCPGHCSAPLNATREELLTSAGMGGLRAQLPSSAATHRSSALRFSFRAPEFGDAVRRWDAAHIADTVSLQWFGAPTTQSAVLGPLLHIQIAAQGDPRVAPTLERRSPPDALIALAAAAFGALSGGRPRRQARQMGLRRIVADVRLRRLCHPPLAHASSCRLESRHGAHDVQCDPIFTTHGHSRRVLRSRLCFGKCPRQPRALTPGGPRCEYRGTRASPSVFHVAAPARPTEGHARRRCTLR